MREYTSSLLVAVVAGLTMIINPCQAQTVDNTDTSNSGNNDISATSQANEDITDIDNSTKKSVVPSDAVSQASEATKPTLNPRIPIQSRIFPFPSMQQ